MTKSVQFQYPSSSATDIHNGYAASLPKTNSLNSVTNESVGDVKPARASTNLSNLQSGDMLLPTPSAGFKQLETRSGFLDHNELPEDISKSAKALRESIEIMIQFF